jgi:hypothetical protein
MWRRIATNGWRKAIALAVIGLSCAGCDDTSGPPRGSVSGQVQLDGQPLAEGVISFLPADGVQGPSAGAAIKDGKYSIPRETGPVAGNYRIEISALKKTGRMIELGSPEPPGTKIAETAEALPAKYNSNSTLQETIKAGNNPLNFDLKTK